MVDSVATVWLPVKDMTRAVAFYRDTLGLTITARTRTGARSTRTA